MNRLLACFSYVLIILFFTACKGDESTPDYTQELIGEYDCDYISYFDEDISEEYITGVLTASLQDENEILFNYSTAQQADMKYIGSNFRKIGNKYIVYDIPNQYTGYNNIYLEGNTSIEIEGKSYDGVYFIESSTMKSSFSIDSKNTTTGIVSILTFTFDATRKK